MGWGDEIVAAGQAQRLFDEHGKRVVIVDSDRRPRWHAIWDGNPVIVRPDEYAAGDTTVRVLQNGPNCRPYIHYPFTTDIGWSFNQAFRCADHVAVIYLTADEIARGESARAKYGPYVLIEPYTKHPNFRWPLERWEQLVAACPDLTFVQHTHGDSPIVRGAFPEPADFRQACGLVAEAEVYVRSESGLCHAAAAIGVPQVTLFGGCMDPDVMAGYLGQIVIADRGPGSPCGKWLPCDHCTACMERITVNQVIDALRSHLEVRRVA